MVPPLIELFSEIVVSPDIAPPAEIFPMFDRLPLLSILVIPAVCRAPAELLISPEPVNDVPPEIAPDKVSVPILIRLPELSILFVLLVWIVPPVVLILPEPV